MLIMCVKWLFYWFSIETCSNENDISFEVLTDTKGRSGMDIFTSTLTFKNDNELRPIFCLFFFSVYITWKIGVLV